MNTTNDSFQEPQMMRANRQTIETTCSICRQGFQLAEAVYACPFCDGFHHAHCWETQRQCQPATVIPSENVSDGAATVDLSGFQSDTAPDWTMPAPVTVPLAQELAPDERRCPNCREIIKAEALKCRFCNAVIDARLREPGAEKEPVALPGWHWGIVLALGIVTCGIFPPIWGIRQGYWARQAVPPSNAMLFYSLYLVMALIGGVIEVDRDLAGFGLLLRLGSAVFYQCGNFSIKQSLEEHFEYSLSGVMTFFFGPIYHQYHFTANQKQKDDSDGLSILKA